MSTIECTFEEFKRMAKEFRDSAPTLDLEQLDNAWKCLGLAYLGMKEDAWMHSAASVLRMEAGTYIQRESELI